MESMTVVYGTVEQVIEFDRARRIAGGKVSAPITTSANVSDKPATKPAKPARTGKREQSDLYKRIHAFKRGTPEYRKARHDAGIPDGMSIADFEAQNGQVKTANRESTKRGWTGTGTGTARDPFTGSGALGHAKHVAKENPRRKVHYRSKDGIAVAV